MSHQVESLPLSKQIAYAIGQLGWSTLINIVSFTLVYFYIPPKDAGLPVFVTQAAFFVVLNVITLIAASGRLWDAITDPLIASFSDRSKNRFGRRIPFMFIGALPAAVFCTLMFFPRTEGEATSNIVWLVAIQVLFFLFLTVYVTPFFALLPELGHTASARLNLSTYISVTYALGIMFASAIPIIANSVAASYALPKLQAMQYVVGGVSAVAALLMYVPVFAINEKRYSRAEPADVPLFESIKKCFANPHFRYYVTSDFAYFMAITIIQTGMLYYLTVLLQLEEAMLFPVMASLLVVSFVFYPICNILAKKVGKKNVVLFAFALFGVVFLAVYFLGRLPIPRELQIFLVAGAAAIPMAFLGVLPNAILADIAEHSALQTGARQEGMFFAARTFLQKLGQTFGIITLAGLTNLGKDVGNDLGIRLSGIVGFVLCALAFAIFRFYKESQVLQETEQMERRGG